MFEIKESYKITIFQILKFCAVGVLNTLITNLSFAFLFYVVRINDKVSNVISYIVGLTNSFIFNKLWTFKSKKNFILEIIPFIIVFVIAYLAQFGFYYFLAHILKINEMIAFFAGNVVYTLVGFIGNKLFTFKL
jgi:putative flippase GtrA